MITGFWMADMYTRLNSPAKAVTELGEEKQCTSCGEYWPADTEFFTAMRSSKDGLSPRCIACIKAKEWRLFRPHYKHSTERQGERTSVNVCAANA